MLRLLCLMQGLLLPLAALSGRPPNIVLIVADDLGYGELGSYGQKQIPTPRLDRMAAEGMRFTRFYAGSSVCAPSRSVLMTGLHVGHTQVRGNAGAGGNLDAQTLTTDRITIAGLLRQAGYRTALVGKWGLGDIGSRATPDKVGFDHYFGFLNQSHAHNHFPNFLWSDSERLPLPNDLIADPRVEGLGYSSNRLVWANDLFFADARAFIAANVDRPFFLCLALTLPHANNERSTALGDGMEVPDYGDFASRDWPDHQKGHAEMNTRLDRGVGALLDQLDALGIGGETLVMFTSDNGPHREGGTDYDPEFFDSNGPLNGIKRDLTEGGIRVPLIVRWPGYIPAGSVSDHVSSFGDMMATFGQLAGVEPPPNDGLSLLPTLTGRGNQESHTFLYWELYEKDVTQAVLLEGRWKGIRPEAPNGRIVLYDLQTDPGEMVDRAARYPEIVARIEELMRTQHVPNEHWKIPGI